ncbi:MAG: hypothetical protein ABIQ27_02030 [Flavobacterium sp.]|uniref:hypothetical protein n=1 Tax=Flavobacterium sp. TaxID=239 RepID=UPI003266459B
MILVYKTNIDSKSKAKQLQPKLDKLLFDCTWNFDLEDCDNILRIDAEHDITTVLKKALNQFGIEIQELPD